MPTDDVGDFINLAPGVWTEVPGTGLRVMAGQPMGGLVHVLPDGSLRLLGAYEARVEKIAGNPDISLL